MTEFTREEKLREIAREIALRRRVYPNRVLTKRMSQEKADRLIAIMLDIAKDYGGHGDEEPRQKNISGYSPVDRGN